MQYERIHLQTYDELPLFLNAATVAKVLGLSPGALAVYSYLLCCEDRNTYQCWPSYKTIGSAVKMSANTVRKYVCELEERPLTTKPQRKRSGCGLERRNSGVSEPCRLRRGE